VDTNQVTLLDPSGAAETLPKMTKKEVADIVIGRVIDLLVEGK
jgi:hypothetical protein